MEERDAQFRVIPRPVVSQAEWLAARRALLAKEKEAVRLRDGLNAERLALPWVKVEKNYTFDTPEGQKTLAELFAGRSQLIVYHFMFGPGWAAAAPAARSWPTISTARCRISSITTSR